MDPCLDYIRIYTKILFLRNSLGSNKIKYILQKKNSSICICAINTRERKNKEHSFLDVKETISGTSINTAVIFSKFAQLGPVKFCS